MLLKVQFKNARMLALCLDAVKELHGEDGWVRNGNCADINCCEIADAVKTWAVLFIAVAEIYGIILNPDDIKVTYEIG